MALETIMITSPDGASTAEVPASSWDVYERNGWTQAPEGATATGPADTPTPVAVEPGTPVAVQPATPDPLTPVSEPVTPPARDDSVATLEAQGQATKE